MLPVSPPPDGFGLQQTIASFLVFFSQKKDAQVLFGLTHLCYTTPLVSHKTTQSQGGSPFFSETGAQKGGVFTEEIAWIGWKKSEKT